jgi:hypothetical protein
MTIAAKTRTITPIAPMSISFTVDAVSFGVGVGDIHMPVVAEAFDVDDVWFPVTGIGVIVTLAIAVPFAIPFTVPDVEDVVDVDDTAATVAVGAGVVVAGAWTPK